MPGLEQELLPKFSQMTNAEDIAIKVTVMDACKNFFSYGMCTLCGFPEIELEGSDDDWMLLRSNSESLIRNRCTKDFSDFWCESLLPLLDKINNERK